MQPESATPHPQGVPMVQPAPLPNLVTVTGAQFRIEKDGNVELKEHVVLFSSTPAGTAVCVWELDAAEKIALDVYGAVRRMRANIVLPGDNGGASMRELARDAMNKALEEKESDTNET